MHELSNYLAKYVIVIVFAAYIINDDPRRIWIRVSGGVTTVVHGTNG